MESFAPVEATLTRIARTGFEFGKSEVTMK
jgi:hypothetical protein